ncbi:multicopper oxidase family protein [Paenibacillus sp. BSR1-1]|uniref:multicopper oxidase family protein n=1 Tax=Paenibacillus sp. BSR1-1 TaxID=3020845 RepID=UPI0025B27D58|nr:multicopper oxidase family protein [Paenibacillus sp. BSR1-1]MDN3015972.1 multicopper oxidase family protein [Paenibacillus sp. BSR1-1]
MKRFPSFILFTIMGCLLVFSAVFIYATKEEASAKTEKGQTKVFHLYAADMEQEMAQGTTLYSWGFGLWDPQKNAPATKPSVPGPEIRITEGDHVKVVFHNQQKELHTIHFHGIDNSFAGDGTPEMSQHPTMNHDSFTYEFDASKAGTYFYHCHVEPDRHPEMGLYGAIIVEPKKPKYKTNGEFTLLLSERDPLLSLAEGQEAHQYVGTAAEHLHLDGEYDTTNRKARYYTINGKIDPEIPPLHVKEGGTYLIRLINAGSEVHSFHTHGHHFKVVASDGRDIKNPMTKDTITIGPGEKYDLLLTADNPGIWPIHCHMGPHATHGMHMMMVYDNYHDKMTHGSKNPISDVKHHFALLKQYQFEKNYELMKKEMKAISNGLHEFYNLVSDEHYEEWNSLDNAAATVNQQLNSTVNPEILEKSITDLEQKINNMEQVLQTGDLS